MHRRLSLLVACAALAFAPPLRAAEKADAKTPIDPNAVALVRRMGALLQSAKAIEMQAEIAYDEVLASGRKLQFAAALEASLRRPNGLEIEYRSDLGGKRLWYDGKTFTLLDLLEHAYVAKPAPKSAGALLDALATEQKITIPLADFVADDPAEELLRGVRTGYAVGPGDVGGVVCHHLAFSHRGLDWQIWIDAGEQPLPRKLVLTYTALPGAPQYAATFTEWKFPASIADDVFQPELPADAHAVEFVAVRDAKEKKP
jgi:hypothetical protein